ncbi:cysteine hydrolase [Hwanghaeella grinnelliae]|uniref:Cysteine hydrolase n=1 Tax=Hwanghaeella grinnelliae TaxID=2500179 RepID=A0A3S3URF5_9PROT|nr:cysteine hydrolase family protein [Hwanghaeella grinnelliae]RVU38858.1 cysteine hydrolase [Hwanghaeella grinnelliae]
MSDQPKTLMQMAGADLTPAAMSAAALIVIDAQRVYSDGPLVLTGVGPAAEEIATLLNRARAAATPIVHVRHVGPDGSPFGKDGNGFKYMTQAEPKPGEAEVEKSLPNSFAGTNLDEILKGIGRKKVIIVGFMSHMCVSATARSALDHGYGATVVASAVATRPLPSATGDGTVAAELVHEVAMTELSDRFAIIAKASADIPD